MRTAADVRFRESLKHNGRLRREIARRLAEEQGGLCGICRHPLDDNPTIDHIHPKAKGGRTVRGNLQAAHFACNQIKGELSVRQLAQWIARGWVRLPDPPAESATG